MKRCYWKRSKPNDDRFSKRKYSKKPRKADKPNSESSKIQTIIQNNSEAEILVQEPTLNHCQSTE